MTDYKNINIKPNITDPDLIHNIPNKRVSFSKPEENKVVSKPENNSESNKHSPFGGKGLLIAIAFSSIVIILIIVIIYLLTRKPSNTVNRQQYPTQEQMKQFQYNQEMARRNYMNRNAPHYGNVPNMNAPNTGFPSKSPKPKINSNTTSNPEPKKKVPKKERLDNLANIINKTENNNFETSDDEGPILSDNDNNDDEVVVDSVELIKEKLELDDIN